MQRTSPSLNDIINEEGLIDKGYIALCNQAKLLTSTGKTGDIVMQALYSKQRRRRNMRGNIRHKISRGLSGSLNLIISVASELTRIDATEIIYYQHGRPICYKETGQKQISEITKVLFKSGHNQQSCGVHEGPNIKENTRVNDNAIQP